MASAYPGALDTFAIDKADATTQSSAGGAHAAHHNDLADAINKMEAELGINPSGGAATVVAALALLAPLASPVLTGDPTAPTPASGDNDTSVATSAFARSVAPNASYRVILDSSGSHTAAKVAGTYGFGHGDPLAVTGTGTLYPLNTIYIDSADYPTISGLAPKLRVRAQLYTNDVAPTGNFTIGLHAITRPGTSGGAGLGIYTIAAAVAGSTCQFVTPAADSLLSAVGADFALPSNGHYVLGLVTTATVAASSHVHLSAALQHRNA